MEKGHIQFYHIAEPHAPLCSSSWQRKLFGDKKGREAERDNFKSKSKWIELTETQPLRVTNTETKFSNLKSKRLKKDIYLSVSKGKGLRGIVRNR